MRLISKKSICIFISIMMITGMLCACAGNGNAETAPSPTEEIPTDTPVPTISDEEAAAIEAEKIAAEMKENLTLRMLDNESVDKVRAAVWYEYVQEETNNETRLAEIKNRAMDYGDVTMKYGIQIIGEPDENGYPLYIALHGGGQGDTPDVNNQQWYAMATYYKSSVKNGIYVNPRGVRDTWDTHANPESYPLYDELIENMILFYNVDPERVYILGYSAGGDGVYMIAPRMADRFAAANMSAGHPNGTSVVNLYNTPIQLQVGLKDTSYNRYLVTAEYDGVLSALNIQYGGGYIHNTFIHAKYAHNFYDNTTGDQEVIADATAWFKNQDTTTVMADTNAIRFLNQYTRDSLPETVVWDLGNRASERETESFYWLKASYDTNSGIVVASYSKTENKITIESTTANGDFEILINNDMLDVFSPITIETPKGTFVIAVEPSLRMLRETTAERGDQNYQFLASVSYEDLQ